MKKLVSMALALLLVLSAVPAMAETESGEGTTVGVLSYLTLTEDDYLAVYEAERGAREYLIEQGVVEVVTLGVRFNLFSLCACSVTKAVIEYRYEL